MGDMMAAGGLVLPQRTAMGVSMRPVEMHHGMACRAGTHDRSFPAEAENVYGWMDFAGKRVLDLGANIGSFTRLALSRGAVAVVAVEPEPCNALCWLHNCSHSDRARLELGAASLAPGTTELWISRSHNPASISGWTRGRRAPIGHARSIPMRLLYAERPDIVKMDIEGAEFECLQEPIPDCVRQITVEFHYSNVALRARMPAIMQRFEHEGWRVKRAPVLLASRWNSVGAWER